MAIILVQHASNTFFDEGASANPYSDTDSLPGTTTAGNFLVVLLNGHLNSFAPTSTTVTGAAFGTWQQAGTLFVNGTDFVSVWYCASCNAATNANSITESVAWTGGSQTVNVGVQFLEFSGVVAVSPFDAVSAGATGSSSIPTCGSITTTASDLVIGVVWEAGNVTQTAGAGYVLQSTAFDAGAFSKAYEFGQIPTGTFTTAFGTSSTPAWIARAFAFKAQTAVGVLVQSKQNAGNGVTTVAFTSTNTAGNLLVLGAEANTTSAVGTFNVSDSAGNTWLSAIPIHNVNNNSQWQQIWYVPSCKAGANTLTVTHTSTQNYENLAVAEFSGIATTSPEDGVGATGTGTASAMTSGNFTVAAGDLVVGFSSGPGSWAAGSGFASLGTDTFSGLEYGIAYSTTVAATATSSGGTYVYTAQGVAFSVPVTAILVDPGGMSGMVY